VDEGRGVDPDRILDDEPLRTPEEDRPKPNPGAGDGSRVRCEYGLGSIAAPPPPNFSSPFILVSASVVRLSLSLAPVDAPSLPPVFPDRSLNFELTSAALSIVVILRLFSLFESLKMYESFAAPLLLLARLVTLDLLLTRLMPDTTELPDMP